MSDRDAFLAGFRAGKEAMLAELDDEPDDEFNRQLRQQIIDLPEPTEEEQSAAITVHRHMGRGWRRPRRF